MRKSYGAENKVGKMTKKKGLSPQALLAAVFTLSLLSFVLAALFPSWFYYTMDIAPYLVFHNIAEFFSVMVSLAIFSMGWFTYDQSKNRNALFLACAFLAIGLIDLQHTLGYPGMPEFITQNSAEKSTQFWIAARMFAALAFLASGYVRQGSAGRFLSKGFLLAAAVAVSGVVFVGVIYFPSSLPATFVEGSGLTSYKIYAEYLIIILLILALPVYWKRYASTGKKLLLYMMAALIVCVFSELSFTVYKSAFDTYNTLGHIYKIIAFALIYWGIYVSAVKFPYLELMAETEKLLAETEERKRIETELIQQRHKLEKERQFLEAVFDNIEEGIVSCDAQGIISRFNRATREFHGLPAEPIPAEQWPDHYNLYLADGKTPMVRDDVPLFRALQGEMVRNVEMMIIPADQTTRARSLVANGQPLVSSDGTLLGAVATMHDITASKEAEQALATSEAFRRAIIDSSHDCI
nr:PAS domain-containing protein [Desulfobulbaceae bacterium]